MTEVIENTDIDWHLIIDFESDMCCEAGKVKLPDCSKPVEWKLVTRCCAGSLLICDSHKVENIKFYERYSETLIKCRFCGNNRPALNHVYYEKV